MAEQKPVKVAEEVQTKPVERDGGLCVWGGKLWCHVHRCPMLRSRHGVLRSGAGL